MGQKFRHQTTESNRVGRWIWFFPQLLTPVAINATHGGVDSLENGLGKTETSGLRKVNRFRLRIKRFDDTRKLSLWISANWRSRQENTRKEWFCGTNSPVGESYDQRFRYHLMPRMNNFWRFPQCSLPLSLFLFFPGQFESFVIWKKFTNGILDCPPGSWAFLGRSFFAKS